MPSDSQRAPESYEKPVLGSPVSRVAAAGSKAGGADVDQSIILTGGKLAIVFTAMLFCMLLTALDQTILATALPRIASDFDAFTLQGWVATAFILAQTIFLLFYGQVLRIAPAKYVMLTAILIFEVGSLVCGVAKNINMLIAGRAVTGVGAAGLFVSMMQIVSQVTRLEDRPRLWGLFGAVFGLASVVGPLVGGAFTDRVTWRWCFYINLPFGGVSATVVAFLLKASPPLGSDGTRRTWAHLRRQVSHLDYIGATLVAAFVTCLVLALQWGGNTKPWSDKAVIICFVLSGVFAAATIAWEIWIGEERAMVPTTVFKSRSVFAIILYCFLSRFSLLLFAYYLPIFYQAARNHTATRSGIDLLPFMIAVILSAVVSGQIVSKLGIYFYFLLIAPVFLAVGSGLMYTISPATSTASITGFQILAGIGTGLGMQNAFVAIQAEFRDKSDAHLLGQATAMASFGQFFGGTIGLGVAEPVFATELGRFLARYAPNVPQQIVRQSPTAIHDALPKELISGVVKSYTESLRVVFVLGVPVAGLGLIAAVFIQNIKIVDESAVSSAGRVGGGEKS
ncbi:Major facilitator transporter-like protein [Mycena indigotica]|uniref:Major facilitator transporter-like protein n=1 Tax=Mycena indigotica TaxID=2126181 RepID=A0A8H6T9Z8_9AGAR|nr:Major facilitator transporter-like protein [Mycena indigotica]KAF7314900.1 Major facilitator transporter-like protein [Mycena indigotica]